MGKFIQSKMVQRISSFFNQRRTGTPNYLYAELPIGRTEQYGLRNMRESDVPFSKAKCSSNTNLLNAVHEWNLLDETVRNSATLAEFKIKLITSRKPLKISLFGLFHTCGVKKLIMLRLEFSTLNLHRFKHNFRCISPMCACNTRI